MNVRVVHASTCKFQKWRLQKGPGRPPCSKSCRSSRITTKAILHSHQPVPCFPRFLPRLDILYFSDFIYPSYCQEEFLPASLIFGAVGHPCVQGLFQALQGWINPRQFSSGVFGLAMLSELAPGFCLPAVSACTLENAFFQSVTV